MNKILHFILFRCITILNYVKYLLYKIFELYVYLIMQFSQEMHLIICYINYVYINYGKIFKNVVDILEKPIYILIMQKYLF